MSGRRCERLAEASSACRITLSGTVVGSRPMTDIRRASNSSRYPNGSYMANLPSGQHGSASYEIHHEGKKLEHDLRRETRRVLVRAQLDHIDAHQSASFEQGDEQLQQLRVL